MLNVKGGTSNGKAIVITLEDNAERYEQIIEILKKNQVAFQVIEAEQEKTVLSFEGLQIDFPKRIVSRGSNRIYLTAIEFDILYYLASHPELVFTHRQIYEAIWKREYVCDSGNVTAHIGHIRKKIEPDPRHPTYVQTVRGIGYKFVK